MKLVNMKRSISFINRRKFNTFLLAAGLFCMPSCSKFLDVVPDNIATLDYAFRSRLTAEQFLFTCYAYLPGAGSATTNPALTSVDELWVPSQTQEDISWLIGDFWQIARGNQQVVSPVGNIWSNGNSSMFKGIRDCNIFLENIESVPDVQPFEKKRWIAEVQFLKAYYHWELLRRYGPIPIVDKNLPISVSPEEAQEPRQPADSCFNYVLDLLAAAAHDLPNILPDPVSELGRITRPVALAIRARVAATAASPLFNGNSDYAGVKNKDGTPLFNATFSPEKWALAADACEEAIDAAHTAGLKLYKFSEQSAYNYNLSPEMETRMDIRNAVTQPWNLEVIWGDANSVATTIQELVMVPYNASNANANGWWRSRLSPPLKMAELFYTKNGVPIHEDKTLDYNDITALRIATYDERFQIKEGYETARLHFDREPRFYANLGFDGGILFGAGNFDENNTWHYEGKRGQYSVQGSSAGQNITGYFCKKLVSYRNTMTSGFDHSVEPYPWPIIRLADLYLLYAEALNERDGPGAVAYDMINRVRARAGIPSVEESWTLYANNPTTHTTKDGLRRIIHTERMIELAFEGIRFWDLCRWKESEVVLNRPIQTWNMTQSDAASYYRVQTIFGQTFSKRDYLWPIPEQDLIVNKNLVQNFGW